MFTHLVKLIWNKKKAHSLLIVEIWASFLVLFGLSTLLVHNIRNYRAPLGFQYENVWGINLNNNQDTVAIAPKMQSVIDRLKTYPEVDAVSRMSDNVPFATYHNFDEARYKKTPVGVSMYQADDAFGQTLQMPVVAGSWFRNSDSTQRYRPAIINRKAQEALFGNENPVGKVLDNYENKPSWRVAGVIDNFKGRGEFMANEPALIELVTADQTWCKSLLVRVKPGTDASVEARLVRDITVQLKGWSVDVNYLTDLRKTHQNITLVPAIIFIIISLFLLINVALGLFGVLNVSITKRRGEIGLRRAIGATGARISGQFIAEMWVLATFALLLGLLIAAQFPLLNVFDLPTQTYLMAMAISVVVIYLLVTLCTLFPSRQAATIQPATALHEG